MLKVLFIFIYLEDGRVAKFLNTAIETLNSLCKHRFFQLKKKKKNLYNGSLTTKIDSVYIIVNISIIFQLPSSLFQTNIFFHF